MCVCFNSEKPAAIILIFSSLLYMKGHQERHKGREMQNRNGFTFSTISKRKNQKYHQIVRDYTFERTLKVVNRDAVKFSDQTRHLSKNRKLPLIEADGERAT